MADANSTTVMKDDRTLNDVFLEGWQLYEFLDETAIPFNGMEYQGKVKAAMENFELATRIVSQFGMFSSNEIIDEVPTESLQYMMLPYFLGQLAMKRNEQDRADALRVADIYFRDFIQRCSDYELCDALKKENNETSKEVVSGCIDTTQQLVASAVNRNRKIEQFKRKKELEEYLRKMKTAVKANSVDDEVKREFFIKFLNKAIIESMEELDNIKLEKGVVEMRKQRMAEHGTTKMDDFDLAPYEIATTSANNDHHHHGHVHHHNHRASRLQPKPKALQPFIITRDATQKAVFGMGYPSLPIMTVDEFYSQRVHEGIFPDEEKMKQINQQKAIAAARDPEEVEEEEKAVVEQQIEDDDPEYVERMRRMDEYKDVVRRGDGNRHNRS